MWRRRRERRKIGSKEVRREMVDVRGERERETESEEGEERWRESKKEIEWALNVGRDEYWEWEKKWEWWIRGLNEERGRTEKTTDRNKLYLSSRGCLCSVFQLIFTVRQRIVKQIESTYEMKDYWEYKVKVNYIVWECLVLFCISKSYAENIAIWGNVWCSVPFAFTALKDCVVLSQSV